MSEDYQNCSVYTDGGVVSKNPSIYGGSWAWVVVAPDGITRLDWDSGFVEAPFCGLETVSNNVTELLAARMGLGTMPDGWSGDWYTDSLVTLLRMTKDGTKMNGVPASMQEDVRSLRARLGPFKGHLLGGHPNRNELISGVRKDGKPVSAHNVFCDSKCVDEIQKYLRAHAGQIAKKSREEYS